MSQLQHKQPIQVNYWIAWIERESRSSLFVEIARLLRGLIWSIWLWSPESLHFILRILSWNMILIRMCIPITGAIINSYPSSDEDLTFNFIFFYVRLLREWFSFLHIWHWKCFSWIASTIILELLEQEAYLSLERKYSIFKKPTD